MLVGSVQRTMPAVYLAHADEIDEYMAKGIDKRSVAKLLDVAPNTLYAWLKVRRSGAAALRDAP